MKSFSPDIPLTRLSIALVAYFCLSLQNLSTAQTFEEEPIFLWPYSGVVTSEWGERFGSFHDGIDIACLRGAPIKASRDGIVVRAGRNSRLGFHVIIDHKDGFKTVYGHGSETTVKENQEVSAGDSVILCGSTGISTGPHLHFEVYKDGEKINPRKVLGSRPVY